MSSITKLQIRLTAKMCHEINKFWCELNDDNSQKNWNDAPDWAKESAIKGVEFHIANPNANASSSHDSWMKEKLDNGWQYGETKDENLKTHPCIVPFEMLPKYQQIKDHLFKNTVHAILLNETPSSKTSVTDVGFNPSGDPTITKIKTQANVLAEIINELPNGRRKSIVLTKLEDTSMWGVKAAACGDD